MGEWIEVASSDGFEFGCYTAAPAGAPKGGMLVIQEIFGVNAHIREVADGYAADGYLAWAPSLYDRVERRFECGYTPEDIAKARDIMVGSPFDVAVGDMAATVEGLRAAGAGKIGSVGYCWGGSASFLVATRIGVDASVCYYGGQIAPRKDEAAKNPLLMHFGEQDHGIPMEDVEAIRAAQPAGRGPHLPRRPRLQLRPSRRLSRGIGQARPRPQPRLLRQPYGLSRAGGLEDPFPPAGGRP